MKATYPIPRLPACRLRWLAVCTLLILGALSVHAQWQTETFLIKPGWNAIYLNVDASYQSLDNSVGADTHNPINQVWLWQPPTTTLQFVTSPATPSAPNSQWATWGRVGTGISDTLLTLVPNNAYLVYSVATTNYTWNVKGQPVVPAFSWSSSGLNFFGFSTPGTNAPNFDQFLALSPTLYAAQQIFTYPGGELSPVNPIQVFALRTTTVTRGQAYWIRANNLANNYFGPFQVIAGNPSGAAFGDSVSQYSFRLHNPTATNVTVSMRLVPSEAPPPGQTNITGTPALLVRGAFNTSTATYGYTNLSLGSTQSWVLTPQGTPGADTTIVIGLNRSALTNVPGALYAGILQLSDSFGFSEYDLPVSGVTSATAGLWVGNASVSQVSSYLKNYQMDSNNAIAFSTNGSSYQITSINTNLAPVAQPYPLRLILHNDGTNVNLLQRVFYGTRYGSNYVVATQEAFLDATNLSAARRISAIHLPYSEINNPWACAGSLALGGSLSATVNLSYDDQRSNPFLHTYHPDHDNLDAQFATQLPQGSESYGITRSIHLFINPPGSDFASLTSVNQSFSGIYQEAITLSGLGGFPRVFNVTGTFALNRLTPIPTLTKQ